MPDMQLPNLTDSRNKDYTGLREGAWNTGEDTAASDSGNMSAPV